MTVGFIGLGRMGEPMAVNLLRAGVHLNVWNRSPAALEAVSAIGARRHHSPRAVLEQSDHVILMLANAKAIDEILCRGTNAFGAMVPGRTIINMGTVAPEYSARLAQDIVAAGGAYVEAPVSGSRAPAQQGQLVGMLAGERATKAQVRPILDPMCSSLFDCGKVPNALTMKLAVNLFLITMVTGLAEAAHFALNRGVDIELFRTILDAGPMASSVSRVKMEKLARSDMSAHASISDVLMNSRLIFDAARSARISTPLLDQSCELYGQAELLGVGTLDMIAVGAAIEQLTSDLQIAPRLHGD